MRARCLAALISFLMAPAVVTYTAAQPSLEEHRTLSVSPGGGSGNGLIPAATLTPSGIDSFITDHMQRNRSPGLAACIVKGGRLAWEGYYGYADWALQKAVGPNTSFMLASVSKTVTGTALLQLWEQGKFQLDDDVGAHLTFSVRNPHYPGVPITFRQLMSHVSSINDTWDKMPYFQGDSPLALGWYLSEYLTPKGSYYAATNYLGTAPGTQFTYCNVAVALCGYLVEAISGVPFDRYCRDSIFVPLGMTNTAWFIRDLDTTLIARPYTWSSGGYVDHGLYGYTDFPAGALRTTARSLGQFLLAHIGWGRWNGVRILDSTTIRLIRTVQYPKLNSSWGMIWFREAIGGRICWGHGGRDAGVQTWMYLAEAEDYGVIVLTNFSPADSRPVAAALLAMADTMLVDVNDQSGGPEAPTSFVLEQNYPNPFNPTTVVSFQLSAASAVRLAVYDLLGREVAVLVNERKEPGTYTVRFDATRFASGVYVYRLTAGGVFQTRRMLRLR